MNKILQPLVSQQSHRLENPCEHCVSVENCRQKTRRYRTFLRMADAHRTNSGTCWLECTMTRPVVGIQRSVDYVNKSGISFIAKHKIASVVPKLKTKVQTQV